MKLFVGKRRTDARFTRFEPLVGHGAEEPLPVGVRNDAVSVLFAENLQRLVGLGSVKTELYRSPILSSGATGQQAIRQTKRNHNTQHTPPSKNAHKLFIFTAQFLQSQLPLRPF